MNGRGAGRLLLSLAGLLWLLTPALHADEPKPRFTLLLDGGLALKAQAFAITQTIREFAEDGRIASSYAVDRGPSFEAGLQYRIRRHLGVMAAVASRSREQSGSFEASLPHPLYLARPRVVSGDVGGSYRETAVHLDVVYVGHSRRLDVRVFGGPSWFAKVKAEILSGVTYSHAYPYNTVTIQTLPNAPRDGSGVGFNLGAGLDWRLAERFGLGLQGRYSRASLDLTGTGAADAPLSLDAGGITGTVGLRIRFHRGFGGRSPP